MRCCCGKRGCAVTAAVTAFLLAALAVCVQPLLHDLIHSQIRQQVLLDKQSNSRFEDWRVQAPSAEQGRMVRVFIYNVKNAPDVLYKGVKPELEELGPFVYSFGWERFNLTWEDGGDTLKYREWKYYRYEAELSAYPDDTKVFVTNANLAFQGIFATLGKFGATSIIEQVYGPKTTEFEKLFIKLNVNQWVFGYNDTAVWYLHEQLAAAAPPLMVGLFDENRTRDEAVRMEGPMKWNRIHTGKTKRDMAFSLQEREDMEYLQVCGNTRTPQTPCPDQAPGALPYRTKDASQVGGSDGTNFPPGLKENVTLRLWADPVVRFVEMRKTPGEVIRRGIKLWNFATSDAMWADASKVKENKDYFQARGDGLLNLTGVQHGAPIFLSKPHFLDAPENLRSAVTGLSPPDREKHDFALLIEPWTGLNMGGAGRLQPNVDLMPLTYVGASGKKVSLFSKMKPVMMPIGWLGDGGDVNEPQASQFHRTLGIGLILATWGPRVVGGLALISLLATLVLCRWIRKDSREALLANRPEGLAPYADEPGFQGPPQRNVVAMA